MMLQFQPKMKQSVWNCTWNKDLHATEHYDEQVTAECQAKTNV